MKDPLSEKYRAAYWKAQRPWMEYVVRTGDQTNGMDLSGTQEKDELANNWRAFFAISAEWEASNPPPLIEGYGSGSDPLGYPIWYDRRTNQVPWDWNAPEYNK